MRALLLAYFSGADGDASPKASSSSLPLISVVTPTFDKRHDFHERLHRMFEWQVYPNKELVVSAQCCHLTHTPSHDV